MAESGKVSRARATGPWGQDVAAAGSQSTGQGGGLIGSVFEKESEGG